MEKRIVPSSTPHLTEPRDESWLNLERLASVELTSEDPAHPIESALLGANGSGWHAAQSGEQTIRLVFHSPQQIRRIWLEFVEPLRDRTQQFVLRWSGAGGTSFREIVRQQWNFSSNGATQETEDYRVELTDVTVIELNIVPDIGGGDAIASLARMRVA